MRVSECCDAPPSKYYDNLCSACGENTEFHEYQPCPDDDDYPCSECGEPTGRGYDSGKCCSCSGE